MPRSREDILDDMMSLSSEHRIAIVIEALMDRYPEKVEMLVGLIALQAIFARVLPSQDKAHMVEALRSLSDEIEQPLLEMVSLDMSNPCT